jgi:uncharacterized protein (TIGR02453 family)
VPKIDSKHYFTPALFKFMRELKDNNERKWFNENKHRYIGDLKEPAMDFVLDFGQHLDGISPHFKADPRGQGGSLFRIYRDVRFSKNKDPYKTHTGIYFSHLAGKGVHTPGFYLNLEPKNNWVGLGIWRPDSPTLKSLRQHIADNPAKWRRVVNNKAFKEKFKVSGSSLIRPPKGFDPEHPLIDVLKMKDFTAVAPLKQSSVTSDAFMSDFVTTCRAGAPLVRLICQGINQPF